MNQRRMGAILSYIHIFVANTISLIYTPYMLRVMGQNEYGLYGTAGSFVSYLSVLSFGIGGAYIRFNAKCRASNDWEAEKRLNGMFLTIFSVLGLLAFVVGMILIGFAGTLTENTLAYGELRKLQIMMFLLIINLVVTFICNVFMMALQAYEKFFFIRIVLLITAILTPVINVLVLSHGGKAVSITLMSLIISITTYIVFFLYARKAIKLSFSFRGFEKRVFREIFVFSGFLFLNSITEQITFSTDSIVLVSLIGSAEVAIYTVGSSFRGYFMQFSTSVSSVFAPQINRIVAEKRSIQDLESLFIRIGRIQFYIVSLVLIGYVSIGKSFIMLWAGQEYENSYWIGLLLMISVFVPAFQNVGLEIQKAMNMHRARSVAYFIIALLNVIITIPVSMRFGGIGAAAVTMLCMFIGTVLFMNWYYGRYVGLNIKLFWSNIISILPGFSVPIAIGFLINQYCILDSYLRILGSAVIISISFLGSAWFFSMNEYERKLFIRPFELIRRKK